METKDLTPTFIAKKPCGCVVFAMVDEPNPSPQYRNELAKEIANCIKQGLTIEKVTVDYIRNLKTMGCTCDKVKKIQPKDSSQSVMELKV